MPKDGFGKKGGHGMRHWGGRHSFFKGGEGGWEHSGRHFGHGHMGHRIFDQGDLRYVILKLIAEKPSYGYELIKAIEERMEGAYAPSPGLVYPTLTMLEEMGLAAVETDGNGKKLYSVTPQGKTFLKDNKAIVDVIFARMEDAASLHKRSEAPQIVRAIQNLRFTLKLKASRGELTDKQIRAIAETIDDAARKIEQC